MPFSSGIGPLCSLVTRGGSNTAILSVLGKVRGTIRSSILGVLFAGALQWQILLV